MHATASSFLVRKKTRDDEWMDGSTTSVSIGSSFSIVTCEDLLAYDSAARRRRQHKVRRACTEVCGRSDGDRGGGHGRWKTRLSDVSVHLNLPRLFARACT
jgi:hypothetical protein